MIWANLRTSHHRWMANYLRRRGWVVFYLGRAGLVPPAVLSTSLAVLTMALGLTLRPAPEPPEPPTLTDFGGYRPHYQGHGTTTPGGRGGEIRRVTNATELADAVRARSGCDDTPQRCARVIVFDASGNYSVPGGQLTIDSPFLTLAGQTGQTVAPSCIGSLQKAQVFMG